MVTASWPADRPSSSCATFGLMGLWRPSVGWVRPWRALVNRSLRRLGQLLVVMGAPLGAMIGVALALRSSRTPRTAGLSRALGRERAPAGASAASLFGASHRFPGRLGPGIEPTATIPAGNQPVSVGGPARQKARQGSQGPAEAAGTSPINSCRSSTSDGSRSAEVLAGRKRGRRSSSPLGGVLESGRPDGQLGRGGIRVRPPPVALGSCVPTTQAGHGRAWSGVDNRPVRPSTEHGTEHSPVPGLTVGVG